MVTGWKTISGDKYYFESNGTAVTDTKDYKGYDFDKDGVATKHVTRTYSNSSSNSSSSYVGGNYNPSGSAGNSGAASIAMGYVGGNYVWGGATPSGFDCSGLIYYAYGQAGVSVPRSGYGQAGVGSAVSYNNMKSGDIIVWDGGSHVSIYIGGGQMVHAANPSQGVIVSNVNTWASYGQSITGIRRP